ncbi:bifunctional DNA primase/polymerase [Herbiconiux sp. YIM B11900]|uniref:bifunctional DNA primase/polymerase n=1 Tax=Herbiconiux sp. YIM B11900 TaxID=3404131 RepID=UPI003F851637
MTTRSNSEDVASYDHAHRAPERTPAAIDSIELTSPLSAWAGVYAALGFAVHPLVPGRTTPLLKGWPAAATDDSEVVRDWWRLWPDANIGIATGASGLRVIDVDVKNDPDGTSGYKSLIEFERQHPDFDVSHAPLVRTPSGGSHIYLTTADPVMTRIGWLPDVDLLADGNRFVVAPPSVRVHSNRERSYRLVRGSFAAIPRMPGGLLGGYRSPVPQSGRSAYKGPEGGEQTLISDSLALGSGLVPSTRNISMYRLTCRWWARYGTHNAAAVWTLARAVWLLTPDRASFPWSEVEGLIEGSRRFIAEQDESHHDTVVALRWTS